MEENNNNKEKKTFAEEFTVAGNELVKRVKELIQQGNVRRLIIRRETGEVLIEIPLTAGVAVGGVLTILAPVIAAIGAIAGLLARVKIEVVRVDDKDKDE